MKLLGYIMIFLFSTAAYAQVSALRITCTDDNIGAEVSVNGKLKGDCPLDIQVKPGKIQLQAVKPISGGYERIFAQEFNVGEGVIKKVEIQLGSPQLSEAARQEQEKIARLEDEKYKNLPIPTRYEFPLFSEEQWKYLESNPAYLRYANLVKRGSMTFSQNVKEFYEEGNFANEQWAEKYVLSPVNSGFHSFLFNRNTTHHNKMEAVCVFGCLIGYSLSGYGDSTLFGSKRHFITKKFTINGSLFPFREGAAMQIVFMDNSGAAKYNRNYRIGNKITANKIHKSLPGDAWQVEIERGDERKLIGYYLEATGYFLDLYDHRSFVESPGAEAHVYQSQHVKITYSNRQILIEPSGK